jgi:hypothetical protein
VDLPLFLTTDEDRRVESFDYYSRQVFQQGTLLLHPAVAPVHSPEVVALPPACSTLEQHCFTAILFLALIALACTTLGWIP